MRILVLSGLQLFPARSGGQLRSTALVEHLARRGCTVDVYALVGRKADYLAGVGSSAAAVRPGVTEHVRRGPVSALLTLACYRLGLPPLWIPAALALYRPRGLRRLAAAADWVIVDFPFLYPGGGGAAPVVLSTHNVEAALCRRAWLRGLVGWLERRAARAAAVVVCAAPADAAHFAAVGGGTVVLVPNGVDEARFAHAGRDRDSARTALALAADETALLFAASSFAPNAEGLAFLAAFAAREATLLARLKLRFVVVGSVAPQASRAPGLTVTGPVAAVEPYFAAADVAVNAVFRGSGSNIKMCEYMAARLPILTTDMGRRGFALDDGAECVLFDRESLASVLATSPVLKSRDAAARMAAAAFARNQSVISMEHAIASLVERLAQYHKPP